MSAWPGRETVGRERIIGLVAAARRAGGTRRPCRSPVGRKRGQPIFVGEAEPTAMTLLNALLPVLVEGLAIDVVIGLAVEHADRPDMHRPAVRVGRFGGRLTSPTGRTTTGLAEALITRCLTVKR